MNAPAVRAWLVLASALERSVGRVAWGVEHPRFGLRRRRARLQRREVERLSPEAQDRRMAAMLDNLDRLDLQRLAARWPIVGEGEGHADHVEHIEEPQRRREAARYAAQLATIEQERKRLGTGVEGPSVLTRASAWLAAIPGATSGQGRHTTTWGVVLRTVRGWGLPEDVALDLLVREYAPRCQPSWKRRDLQGMVRLAGRSTRTGYGWLLEGRARA